MPSRVIATPICENWYDCICRSGVGNVKNIPVGSTGIKSRCAICAPNLLDVKTVRYDTIKVAKRLEAGLGENQASFIEGEPGDWDLLPLPGIVKDFNLFNYSEPTTMA